LPQVEVRHPTVVAVLCVVSRKAVI
jgi:hypothetical protein